MSKTAFVFPGQGAQYVGMAKAMTDRFPELNEKLETANEVLGFDIRKLMFEGPEKDLSLTANTQPAILIASVLCMIPFLNAGAKPDLCAGLSLGEYTAHVLSGTFDFEDAVALVRKRGRFMQDEVPEGTGGMAVAVGLTEEELKPCVEEASQFGQIYFSNYNCPGQITVSGEINALKKFVEITEKKGSKKSLLLNVSAPFHSPMLAGAGEKLYRELDKITLKEMKVPVVSNADAKIIKENTNVKELLKKQIYSPVLLQQSVETMIEAGVDTFVEIGPGSVLKGLIKKINRSATVYNISDPETLDQTIKELNL
jgi:[acyl-carrier-protein] S-malonyltransferase